MTASRAYQAGYESVLEKLAVSQKWVDNLAHNGVMQRMMTPPGA